MTHDKLERLQTKHAEAKQLKEDIDRRSATVQSFLRLSLNADELNDYAYFVRMKSKLTIELQELDDKITLGQEQIQELRKSIPERANATSTSTSSSSPVTAESSSTGVWTSPKISPSSSPVPSAS
jgi:protein Shroom